MSKRAIYKCDRCSEESDEKMSMLVLQHASTVLAKMHLCDECAVALTDGWCVQFGKPGVTVRSE